MKPTSNSPVSDYLMLTQREREVANMVADGMDNKAIAMALGLKRGVVSNMIARIYHKLGYTHLNGVNIRVTLANMVNSVRQKDLG